LPAAFVAILCSAVYRLGTAEKKSARTQRFAALLFYRSDFQVPNGFSFQRLAQFLCITRLLSMAPKRRNPTLTARTDQRYSR
jgi:hypothetical protein